MATADCLIHFEATVNAPGAPTPSLSACKIRCDHLNSLWQTVKAAYDICSDCIAAGVSAADTKSILKSKYYQTYSTYEICPKIPRLMAVGFLLSTQVFSGDYLRWPTFRDLFTAIYIDNPSLTPVEKLFHLNSKTSGEAHSIVRRSPLTNDGFRSAWNNLSERFENKRLQVNSQLKTLFNVQSIAQESGAASFKASTHFSRLLNFFKIFRC